MTTAAERARGLELWAKEGATLDEVIAALVKADLAAQHWAVAQKVLDDRDIRVIEATAQALLRGGTFDEHLPHAGPLP